MADIGEITATLRANITDFQGKLKQAEEALKGFGGQTQKTATGTSALWGFMGRLTATFIGFNLAVRTVRASMNALVQDTTKLDTAMGQVHTLTDKSRLGMIGLKDEIQNMSRVIPKSAQDLAMGLYETMSSGILDTSDAMIVMKESAKLAAAGLLDTFSAVDAVTTALNAYNMKAKDVTQVTDAFFETVKLGKITIPTLAGSIGNTASSAALAGVSLDHLGAAIATMTKLGVDANITTNALNRLFLTVAQSLPKTAAAARALGLEWTSTALKAKGLPQFLKDIEVATGGDIDKLASLQLDLRAIRSLFILSGTGAQLFADTLAEFEHKEGAAAEAFAKTNTRIEAQARLVRNRLAVEFEHLGQVVIPPVIHSLLAFTEALEGPADKASRLLDELGHEVENVGLRGEIMDAKFHISLQQMEGDLRSFDATNRGVWASIVEGMSKAMDYMAWAASWWKQELPGMVQATKQAVAEMLRTIAGYTTRRDAMTRTGTAQEAGVAPPTPPPALDIIGDRLKTLREMKALARDIYNVQQFIFSHPDVRDQQRARQTLQDLNAQKAAFEKHLALLGEYEKTQRDIYDNFLGMASAISGLDKAVVPFLLRAMTFNGQLGDQLQRVAELAAATVGTEAIKHPPPMEPVDVRKLGYFRLRDAVEATEKQIYDIRIKYAGAANEDVRAKLKEQEGDAQHALEVYKAALSGLKIPTLDWSKFSTAEAAAQLKSLQDQLRDTQWELKLEMDPEKKAALKRDIAEIEAQISALVLTATKHGKITLGVSFDVESDIVKAGRDLNAKLAEVELKLSNLSLSTDARKQLTDELHDVLRQQWELTLADFRIHARLTGQLGMGEQMYQGKTFDIATPKGLVNWQLAKGLRPLQDFPKWTGKALDATEAWGTAIQALRTQLAGARGDFVGVVTAFITAMKAAKAQWAKDNPMQAALGQSLGIGEQMKEAGKVVGPMLAGLAAGLIMDKLSSITRGDQWKAFHDSVIENTKAIDANTKALIAQKAVTIPDITAVPKLIQQAEAFARTQSRTHFPFDKFVSDLMDRLHALGLSFSDLQDIAQEYRINLSDGLDAFRRLSKIIDEQLGPALERYYSGFQAGMDLLEKSLDAAGVTDAMDRFQAEVGFVINKLAAYSPEFAAKLREAAKTPESWAKFVQDFIKRLQAGDVTVFKDLGDISVTDFLEWISSADNALKGLSDSANSVSNELRNVPSGYKVALARFQADTGEAARGLRDRIDNIPVPGPTDVGLGQTVTDIQRAASSFTSGISAFSMDATDVLQNELLPALQMWADAFRNPLTGAGFTPMDLSTASPLTMLPQTAMASTAPPLGPSEATGASGGSGSAFHIQSLTVVSNDPDDMLTKIETRAKQKARLGGVSQLDLAVNPVGRRGTGTGVR